MGDGRKVPVRLSKSEQRELDELLSGGLPVNGKFGISTSNHEPVDGISGHESTDFTPEFLPCCHALSSVYPSLVALHFTIEDCRRFGVSTVNSPTCSFFTAPRRWAA